MNHTIIPTHLKKLKKLFLLKPHDSSKPPSSFLGLGPSQFRFRFRFPFPFPFQFQFGHGDLNPKICRFHSSKTNSALLSSSSDAAAAAADDDHGVNSNNNNSDDGIERRRRRRRRRISASATSQARAALFDYLHLTRDISCSHAEHISSNCPLFLRSLFHKIGYFEQKNVVGVDIQKSITHFLRYHPINEFEPFFESIGLKPPHSAPLLAPHLMFLADQALLLENYRILCDLGIAPHNIGKIYARATRVFQYDYGVLQSEVEALTGQLPSELNQSFLVKLVGCSPSALMPGRPFLKVLEILKHLGIDHVWIEGNLSEAHFYDWYQILRLLQLYAKMGCSKDQFRGLVIHHPQLLFEGSGNPTLSLIALLLKFGFPMGEIASVFLQFPLVRVGEFLRNLRLGNQFLIDIGMQAVEIGRFVRLHALLIGSCSLKKASTLRLDLRTGFKGMRAMINRNPDVLKNWVIGSRAKKLPPSPEVLSSLQHRINFLLGLGFDENSVEIKRVLRLCKGKGGELQERFDCFVKAGLDRKDILKMIKMAPHLLNQSKDVIEKKIDRLLNDFGYPLSTLVTFPGIISWRMENLNLKVSMYNWLQRQGVTNRKLSLKSVLTVPNQRFVQNYVNLHPRGPEVWEKLKEEIYSD